MSLQNDFNPWNGKTPYREMALDDVSDLIAQCGDIVMEKPRTIAFKGALTTLAVFSFADHNPDVKALANSLIDAFIGAQDLNALQGKGIEERVLLPKEVRNLAYGEGFSRANRDGMFIRENKFIIFWRMSNLDPVIAFRVVEFTVKETVVKSWELK